MAISINEITSASASGSHFNEYELDLLAEEINRLRTLFKPSIPFGWEKGRTGYLAFEVNLGDDLLGSIAYIQGLAIVGYLAEEQIDNVDLTNNRKNVVATLEWLLERALDRTPVLKQFLQGVTDAASGYTAGLPDKLQNLARNDITRLEDGNVVIYQGHIDSWHRRIIKTQNDLKDTASRVDSLPPNKLILESRRARISTEELHEIISFAIRTLEDAEPNTIRDPIRDRSTEPFGDASSTFH